MKVKIIEVMTEKFNCKHNELRIGLYLQDVHEVDYKTNELVLETRPENILRGRAVYGWCDICGSIRTIDGWQEPLAFSEASSDCADMPNEGGVACPCDKCGKPMKKLENPDKELIKAIGSDEIWYCHDCANVEV